MIKVFSYVKLQSLKRAIQKRLDEDGAAKIIYVLPSKSNESMLLDMLRRSGNYFASRPEVWGWQDIYNSVVPKTERRRCVDPPDHYLALQYIRDQVSSEMERSGAPLPPGAARRGFLTALSEAVNEMLLEDVAPEMVAGHDILRKMYSGYLEYLTNHGLADHSELPSLTRRAIADGASAPSGVTFRWIGFMSFTGAQLKLIGALVESGADMEFYTPDSGGVNFRDAAAQLGAQAVSVESGECAVRRAVARDIYAQCEFIADFIARQDADCGILTEPGMTQALAAALSRKGLPWQSLSEVTVDRTALLDTARAAWEAHKLGWPPARTLNLLRGHAMGVEPDMRKFTAIMPEGLEMWREFFSDDADALEALGRAETFCRVIGREDGGAAEELLRALYALSGGGWESRLAAEAAGDAEMDPAIREIVSSRLEIENKLAMLGDVSPALGEAASVRFSGDGAIEFLISWASEAATALPPRYKGVVSIYESAPPALASHDVWIMTGVDASRYPGASSGHTLLGEDVREAVNASPLGFAHLPTTRERRGQKEALFRRMLAIGENITLAVRSAFDASGKQTAESPFLRPENFTGPHWLLGSDMDCTAVKRRAASVSRKFPKTISSPPPAGKPRISFSRIDRLLDCPFAYWCDRTARFETPPDTSEILDRRCLGDVMHESWRRLAGAAAAKSGAAYSSALLSEWDGIISSLAPRYPLLSDARSGFILADLKKKMGAIADVMDKMRASGEANGMRLVRTETEYTLPALETENAIFTGRADRVDFWERRGESWAVLLDYKLGKDRGYGRSFQLASYGAALRKSGVSVAGFCYLCHGDAKKTGSWSPDAKEIFAKGAKGAACGERMDDALEHMAQAGGIIANGRYEANYDSPSCARCDYATICRRSEKFGDYDADEDDDGDAGDDGE